MNEVAQGEWARRLCGTDKAADIAKHYKEFYELCARHTHTLISNSDPHRSQWGVIAAMADALKQRDERIAALEAKMAALSQDEPEEVEQRRGPGRPRKEMAVA